MDPNNPQQPPQAYYPAYPVVQQPGMAPQPMIGQPYVVQPVYYQQPGVVPQPAPQAIPQYTPHTDNYPPNVPLLSHNAPTSASLPHGSIKSHLLARDYEITIGKWLGQAWRMYCDNWAILSLFTLCIFLISFIPYVGGLLTMPLAFGFFIAGSHTLKMPQGSPIHGSRLFHGYYFFFPLLLICIIYELAVMVGFFLLIIPGFYFLVTLSFAPLLYLEYKIEGLRILEAFEVSRKILQKKFCSVLLLLLAVCFISFIGAFAFFVGLLVSVPVASLMTLFAFRDIFGLSQNDFHHNSCYCC